MLYRSMLSLGSLLLAVSFHGTSAVGLAPRQLQDDQDPVDLRTAGGFAILTKTGVTTTGVTSVTGGDMGTSPIAAEAITGFSLIMDANNGFSTSDLVTGDGKVYAASYTHATQTMMNTAIGDMQAAYTDAAGRSSDDSVLDLKAGIIEGETLTPGLYKWGSNVGFTSSLTFDGAADKVWILQMTGDLIVGAGAIVTLSGGALAENIFWQVAGSTTLHSTAAMEGTILCATSIVFQTGSSLNGKALAQTAVTLDAATIVTKKESRGRALAPRQLDEALPVVDLGTADDFAILTKTGVTTTGVTSVTGDMGTSPIAAAAITGFALTMDSTNEFSKSDLVTGEIRAASYTSPTPSKMTTAISDMETAYRNAASREDPDYLDLFAGTIEGKTLTPGLYKWGSNVGFTSSLTFEGTATDVWILQMTGDLIVGSGARVILSGGALAKNIFWQVAGSTTLHTTAHMEGTILCATAIVFQTGSSLNGKALAQTEVTLDAATIVS
eukprot:scaffold26465_cov59-Phaeocystis_antarctica.AAC.3